MIVAGGDLCYVFKCHPDRLVAEHVRACPQRTSVVGAPAEQLSAAGDGVNVAGTRRDGGHLRASRQTDASRSPFRGRVAAADRKSTRLNSSHVASTYAVFCLKQKIS